MSELYTYPYMAAFSLRRKLGNIGEDVACRFLESKGFQIIDRNYLKPWGEIDIIARKNGDYRFIEVKTISREPSSTSLSTNMTAEDHIHPAKLEKIARTVEIYMANVAGEYDYQVDVVAVELDTSTRRARCKLYEQVL